jgi:uroporphyrinogen-III synthase
VRASDSRVAELIASIDDLPMRRAVEAERTLLSATGGGCRAPIGALATVQGQTIDIGAGFATLDGRTSGIERGRTRIEQAQELATELAARLVARRNDLPDAPRVLVTRSASDSERLSGRLAEFGIASTIVPAIESEIPAHAPELDEALRELSRFDWAVVTSRHAARAVTQASRRLSFDLDRVRWAAVGRSTARELLAAGVRDVWIPRSSNADSMAVQLPVEKGTTVLWLRGDLADDRFSSVLDDRGVTVRALVVYRTIVGPATSRPLLERALADGPLDAILLASPSAVHGVIQLAGNDLRQPVLSMPGVCVGPRTAAAARAAGFTVIGEAHDQDAAALAEETARVLVRMPAGVVK